jgi:hypothetical protein
MGTQRKSKGPEINTQFKETPEEKTHTHKIWNEIDE